MKPLILFAALFFVLPFATAGEAGDGGRGGIPASISVEAYKQYILGDGLKISVRNYYESLLKGEKKPYELKRITASKDFDVRATFLRMLQGDLLQQDISTPDNFVVGLENCKNPNGETNPDQYNPNVRYWTQTGKNGFPNIGGKICFDLERLVDDHRTRGVTIENAAIELTAATYHEIVHHFQEASPSIEIIRQQENEANSVGGFILLHAKTGYEPIVTYSENGPSAESSSKRSCALSPYIQNYKLLHNRACVIHVEANEARCTLSYTYIFVDGIDSNMHFCKFDNWNGRGAELQCDPETMKCVGQESHSTCQHGDGESCDVSLSLMSDGNIMRTRSWNTKKGTGFETDKYFPFKQ